MPVKTAGDPNNPQEVASMDESKKQILKDVFWAMNEISFNTATKTENVVTETDDGNGNIVETTESVTRTYLYIWVAHKSVDEMATITASPTVKRTNFGSYCQMIIAVCGTKLYPE